MILVPSSPRVMRGCGTVISNVTEEPSERITRAPALESGLSASCASAASEAATAKAQMTETSRIHLNVDAARTLFK